MHIALDHYLREPLRAWLEQRYYTRVNEQARLEVLMHDPHFWEAPADHVGLFSDHGVVHVRDVAGQLVRVLDAIHGQLIPRRSAERFDGFMKRYGVILAYLHDIGMADFSAFGRAMHPEFAAQAVFTPELDPLIAEVWADTGELPARLRRLAASGDLGQPPELVLRELLALSMAHSKSKVPVAALNDPARLRGILQQSIGTDLRALYQNQPRRRHGVVEPSPAEPANPAPPQWLNRHYADFARDSFSWLLAGGHEARALVEDVVDTLRALRTADALRQRGVVQKTSGGYEVFISQQTGCAVYALRLDSDRLYLLESTDRMSTGEANIASSELDSDGNLRISFHCGAFATHDGLAHAVESAAIIIEDIRADVVESFRRPSADGFHLAREIETWLESTDDNPGFADMVCAALRRQNPEAAPRVEVVPSLQQVPEIERARYLGAPPLDWSVEQRRELLAQMARSGCKVASIDLAEAFRHVHLAQLQAGEVLVEAGDPANMVYVPLGDGLRVVPLGGYQSFSVQAWMPLGNTGVIRGARRNGTVVADRAVSALMIPRDVYLRHWHRTYSDQELRRILDPAMGG